MGEDFIRGKNDRFTRQCGAVLTGDLQDRDLFSLCSAETSITVPADVLDSSLMQGEELWMPSDQLGNFFIGERPVARVDEHAHQYIADHAKRGIVVARVVEVDIETGMTVLEIRGAEDGTDDH